MIDDHSNRYEHFRKSDEQLSVSPLPSLPGPALPRPALGSATQLSP